MIKRDGSYQEWNGDKIILAVQKAGASSEIAVTVCERVERQIEDRHTAQIERIQDLVESALIQLDFDAGKRYILYREERARRRGLHPDSQAISDYILFSKYARLDLREKSWDDVVNRNLEMHKKYFQTFLKDRRIYEELIVTLQQVYDEFVRPKKVLPSMRSLQFAGNAILNNHARMFNCSYAHINSLNFFEEMAFLLLSGCGVGYSVQQLHISQLPKFQKVSERNVKHYQIPDTIEGWAQSFHELLYAHTQGYYVEFDYSQIRSRGSYLFTSGGKAPGHLPLKKSLEQIREFLLPIRNRQLTSFEVHCVCCMFAEAVRAGGIRRSSLICLFDQDDMEMMKCKTDDWYEKRPYLRMANNSAVLYSDWNVDLSFAKEYGEPGFFRTIDKNFGTNPCSEILLTPGDEFTRGFSFCNLTSINGTTVENERDFKERARAATILGTVQAAYTNFTNKITRYIAERDALLGVSITGIMDNEVVRRPEWQRAVGEATLEINSEFSKKIGINKARRITTVKPSGTESLFLGSGASGHHSHHSTRTFRRVTANANEPAFVTFAKSNPHMIEEKDDGTFCIIFPMEAPKGALTILPAVEFCRAVNSTFENWIQSGSRQECHNVSATCIVREGEWEELQRYINGLNFSVRAMSFLPWVHDYPHSPRVAVKTPIHEAEWDQLIKNYKPVDYSVIDYYTDGEYEIDIGGACDGPTCSV